MPRSAKSAAKHRSNAKLALITGASGGMGMACARQLGRRFGLVLADADQQRLGKFKAALSEEGFDVLYAAQCDIANAADISALADRIKHIGALSILIHTAGLSPALADSQKIIGVNLTGTSYLLDAFVDLAVDDTVAICIASMAAYMCPIDAGLDRIIDQPQDPEIFAKLESRWRTLSGTPGPAPLPPDIAYAISKRGVIRMCEQRVLAWAEKGARIISVSPGMIYTPMGRKEASENSKANDILNLTPVKRWGRPDEIAAAVDFLSSDVARFITGCDLRIDGGITPRILSMAHTQAPKTTP